MGGLQESSGEGDEKSPCLSHWLALQTSSLSVAVHILTANYSDKERR